MRAEHKKEVSDLHDEIALLVAGHRTGAVLEALTRALSNTIGFAADDRGHAKKMCADFSADMLNLIEANWDEIRKARAGVNQPTANA